MLAAIIDLGTNTFNLLVCDLSGGLKVVHSEEVAVFLGQGGIEQGVLTDEAMERGLVALKLFVSTARAKGAERMSGIGTSALRNARNAGVFVERVKRDLDLDIRIISGDEEAELILDGVRQAVTFGSKPTLVMDIGGGSIEFVLATDKSLMWKRSFELGATRLRERFTPTDPITLDQQLRIGSYLDHQLEPVFAVMDRHWPNTLVGSAGSFDTVAAMVAAERGEALGDAVTLAVTHTEFDAIKDKLLRMTRAERSAVPGLPAYRVDTIQLALIAMERVMNNGIETVRWSRYALKEGAAWRAAM